ncbi:MAG: hypothetical protein Terrestrivirus2_1, partial [Terrestrivirus sp.]
TTIINEVKVEVEFKNSIIFAYIKYKYNKS